jgi:hypothetical protein
LVKAKTSCRFHLGCQIVSRPCERITDCASARFQRRPDISRTGSWWIVAPYSQAAALINSGIGGGVTPDQMQALATATGKQE